MRTALILALAAVSWVYVIEAVKQAPSVRWIHFRSDDRLRALSLIGALGIALLVDRHDFVMASWGVLVLQQLVYDGIVHRSTGRHGLR